MTANEANLQEYVSVSHKEFRDVSNCNFSIDAFQLIYHHWKHLGPSPRSAVSFFYYGDTLPADLGKKKVINTNTILQFTGISRRTH